MPIIPSKLEEKKQSGQMGMAYLMDDSGPASQKLRPQQGPLLPFQISSNHLLQIPFSPIAQNHWPRVPLTNNGRLWFQGR